MSIFGDIVNKLFGKAKPDQPAPAVEATPDPAAAQAAAPAAAAAPPPLADVDVAAVMRSNAELAHLDRRYTQGARRRQQPRASQAARTGTQVQRRHERLGHHERLAAHAGHARAGGKRRQAAVGPRGLI
jgi:type IV secretory pathway VirB10-like protein